MEYIYTFDAYIKWKGSKSITTFIRYLKKAGVRYKMGDTRWIGYSWNVNDLIKLGFIK